MDSVHYDADGRSGTETHAFAASIGGYVGSFHHNLLIDCTGRNWSLAGAMEQDGVTYGGALDIRNNVVYNWRDRTTDGGARFVQFVNNYYKAGAVSNTSLHLVSVDGNELNTGDMQKLYASGNMKVAQNGSVLISASADEWSSGKAKSGGKNSTNDTVRSNTPWFESYVNTQSAENAYKSVVANAGATAPPWDYIDSRYIKEVTNGTYTYTGSKQKLKGIIDSQNDAGGYPNSSNFKGGTALADSDGDGMSDVWESAHGLNPNDAKDGAVVSLSGDDYTNLEMHLNELAGDTVEYNGAPITYEPITGNFISAEITDIAYYAAWSIDNAASAGDMLFGDRTAERCAISTVPANLTDAEILLTPCDAKNSSANQAVVTALQDVTLYVGLDSRVENVPAWLAEWNTTRQTIQTSNDVTFNLYSKSLKAGETVTLGANGQSANCMNYIVLASAGSIIGDVNLDGSVTAADARELLKFLLTEKTLTAEQAAQADINGDNKLNAIDLTLLKRQFNK